MSLFEDKHVDNFEHESPLRAFTTFNQDGIYGVGKGFRPSFQHLTRYLDALERKEGWQLVQILFGDKDPTFVLRRTVLELTNVAKPEDIIREMADNFGIDYETMAANAAAANRSNVVPIDDPINPRHYGGTACAEIGERLTANSYQVLKYNWRLGKKDDPCQEIEKSLWYLDREMAMDNHHIPAFRLPDDEWLADRLLDCSDYTTEVAVRLWAWNKLGKPETLRGLKACITHHRDVLACGRGIAP